MKKKFWTVGFIIVFLFTAMYFAVNNFLTPINLGAQPFPLTQKWMVSLSKGSMFDSVVALSKTEDGLLIARTKEGVYAISEDTGKELWFFHLVNQVQIRPAIALNGIVYVSDSKHLSAISQESGKLIWEQKVDSSNWVIDVSEDIVLVNEVANDIVAFDAKTGDPLWRKGVGRGFVSAYINGDLVYIPDHGVEAIDAQTGLVIWNDGNDAVGDSTFLDGIIYYATGDELVAFDAMERIELWRVTLSGFGLKHLLIHDDFVIVTDMEYLYAINRFDSVMTYKITVDAPQNPSFLNNEVYVRGLFNKAVWAFDTDSKEQTGLLGTTLPVLLSVENRDMIAIENKLIFAKSNRLFAYEKTK